MINKDHDAWKHLTSNGMSDTAAAVIYLADVLLRIHRANKADAAAELAALKEEAKAKPAASRSPEPQK
jgi:hypothetical protein